MKTRRYQDDALLELMQVREDGRKNALIVMAPSLGKTVVSAMDVQYFLDENPEARILYLCHNNEVLNQAKKTFKKIFGDERSYGLYNGVTKSHHTDFLFASFQTMALHKIGFEPDEFSYIVVDEAHHAPATTFKAVVDYFKPQFLLGLTATPNRLDGLNLNEIFGEVVYSMDLVEAISNGYVADVDYRLMLDEMQELDSVIVDGEKLSISELNRRLFIPKRDEEIVRLIEQKISERENPRVMVFCRSVEHAENIASLIDGAEVVHSRIEEKECLRRIARFRKGQTKAIVSVDQLNEGVDIPQADVIVFLRSTVSPVIFYQQLGRGLRLHDDKDGVLVLDFVGNCERLEMINDLFDEIKEKRAGFIEGIPREVEEEKEHFTLNIDAPKFKEQLVDILQRINNAKYHSFAFTEEELVSMIRKKSEELGKTPVITDMDVTIEPFRRAFGSWNKALEAAGFQPVNPKTYRSREELISLLQTKAKELGKTPTMREVKNDPSMPSSNTYCEVFGSWTNALNAAGLRIPKERQVLVGYTEEELLSVLRDKIEEIGYIPSSGKTKELGLPHSEAYRRVFGSWGNALEKLGYKSEYHVYSSDELISMLQAKAKNLGRVPVIDDWRNDKNLPSETPIRNVFGTWKKALRAAGLIS